MLIRDAAYRQLLKGTRAELHGRLADWIAARVSTAGEHDETIGWHLEQAHQHLAELGPLDAAGQAIGARAAQYLAAAGRRALARDDLPPAASLLGRALARLAEDDPARADLALDWCEALLAAGDVATGATAVAELGRFASPRTQAPTRRLPTPGSPPWHTCFTGQPAVFTDPQALRATADAVAAAAAVLTAGDAAGEAKRTPSMRRRWRGSARSAPAKRRSTSARGSAAPAIGGALTRCWPARRWRRCGA